MSPKSLRRVVIACAVVVGIGAGTGLNHHAPSVDQPASSPSRAQLQDRAEVVRVSNDVGTACGVEAIGSGWPIGPREIATNAHVVAGDGGNVSIWTPEGDKLPAKVILFDPQQDVAVLSVSGLTLKPLPLSSKTITRGTSVLVIGYPGGGAQAISSGRIGSPLETLYWPDIFGAGHGETSVTTASVKLIPGFSGGPLVAPDGAVVGMAADGAKDGSAFSMAVTRDTLVSAARTASGKTEPVATTEQGHRCLR